MIIDTSKLVNAERLMEILFEPDCRPSPRWLESMKKNRTIPYYKIGNKCFYDPPAVRAKLAAKNLVRAV